MLFLITRFTWSIEHFVCNPLRPVLGTVPMTVVDLKLVLGNLSNPLFLLNPTELYFIYSKQSTPNGEEDPTLTPEDLWRLVKAPMRGVRESPYTWDIVWVLAMNCRETTNSNFDSNFWHPETCHVSEGAVFSFKTIFLWKELPIA